MPIVPLYGHSALRIVFQESAARGSLPACLLLHGPAGVGKQRLALWIGQLLLCETSASPQSAVGSPCGKCRSCRYALELSHPDLHWFFPRPRPKDGDASADQIRDDLREAIAERLADGGLYAPPSGTEGIFVASVRALVQAAAMAPAVARRKVFVVGDAERMVPQEGAEMAANAFLKLLEEPPADTTIILTSSEPGGLLPTIRSRVASIRVPCLSDDEVRQFLADPLVAKSLSKEDLPKDANQRVSLAAGAPGRLFGGSAQGEALEQAQRILKAVDSGRRAERIRAAMSQGSSKARGRYSDTLDALNRLLRDRLQSAADAGDSRNALHASYSISEVERFRQYTTQNANPQLLTAALLESISRNRE